MTPEGGTSRQTSRVDLGGKWCENLGGKWCENLGGKWSENLNLCAWEVSALPARVHVWQRPRHKPIVRVIRVTRVTRVIRVIRVIRAISASA